MDALTWVAPQSPRSSHSRVMPIHLTFRPAVAADIPVIRELAEQVWRVSYAAMLKADQIDYMLGWMYAGEAIAAEMDRGVQWTLAEIDGRSVGYLALSQSGSGVAELHKLYLLPEHQGSGLGQEMLRHARALAYQGAARELRLRVNKTNTRALKSYTRAGFRVVDALVADIGGGFVMDDYVLTMPLQSEVPLVKICGLSTPDTLEAAITAGADQIGLVFFPKSPRHVSLEQARALADQARGRAAIVALSVDATDAGIDAIMGTVRPDWLQLHGSETPERLAALKQQTGVLVMKAIGIATAADLTAADLYAQVADRILFDAKPPKDAVLPGGNGLAFDWSILQPIKAPFMLSGGLSPENVAEAVRISGAAAVDVSSGVEVEPGRKDAARIAAFVHAAKSHSSTSLGACSLDAQAPA